MAQIIGVTLALVWFGVARACTTLVVGKKASKDGTVMVSQSDDGESGADARLCWVPAKDHAPGSLRPVYYDTEDYPRYIGHDRGRCYEPKNGQTPYEPIGYIPQVEHTYAYFDSTFGQVNEHGVGIAESTCSGRFGAKAVGHGGKALLSIDTMSRLALERSTTARAAVQLIGSLAEKFGFYGADNSFEGGSESLMIGDADEAFIFHVLPDPTGTSAIWVAQRVPDDHAGVVANMFVVREVDFNDTHTFLFSESVRKVAVDRGYWKPEMGKLDFTKIYSDGEYSHKFYSGRRMWGAYRLFGISAPDNYTDLRYDPVYPVTALPSAPVSVRDVFSIYRDYYDNTAFDMRKGLAAGPWADPDRWTTQDGVKGSWERSIGIFRTTATHVVQLKRSGQGAVLWYGPHAAAGTVFLPLAARATSVPSEYTIADPKNLSRDSAYWAHRYVYNIAKMKYSYAMQDVRELQTRLEDEGEQLVRKLDSAPSTPESLNAAYAKHATRVVEAFWAMPDKLMQKYADGWLEDGSTLGYPAEWLRAVGYQNGPPQPPAEPGLAVLCDDSFMQSCIGDCSAEGFAACAMHCAGACRNLSGRLSGSLGSLLV